MSDLRAQAEQNAAIAGAIHAELHGGEINHTAWNACDLRDTANRIVGLIVEPALRVVRDAERQRLKAHLEAMKQAADALGIVTFNERTQEFFCRACRYRDEHKLHDEHCPWLEYVTAFERATKAIEEGAEP